MDALPRKAIRRRAQARCEYCHLPEAGAPLVSFQVEHIVARQHEGKTVLSNLAYSCHRCNLFTGPNRAGIDPKTNRMVRLFHPRRMKWALHFRWHGPFLIGRTSVGRATVAVLNTNEGDRVELRQSLWEEGVRRNDD